MLDTPLNERYQRAATFQQVWRRPNEEAWDDFFDHMNEYLVVAAIVAWLQFCSKKGERAST